MGFFKNNTTRSYRYDFINPNTKTRKLIKVIDIFGRETNVLKNTVLFYMYDDGTIEKKYISE